MPGYTKAVKDILRENGCAFFRYGKGDHEIWWNPTTGKKFPVDGDIKSRHTANQIMKQAGINHKF
jgi:predicted RNA binding protein YcfA (HicA-like mRNA interferase family)